MATQIDDEQVIEALRLVYDPELGVNISISGWSMAWISTIAAMSR